MGSKKASAWWKGGIDADEERRDTVWMGEEARGYPGGVKRIWT